MRIGRQSAKHVFVASGTIKREEDFHYRIYVTQKKTTNCIASTHKKQLHVSLVLKRLFFTEYR